MQSSKNYFHILCGQKCADDQRSFDEYDGEVCYVKFLPFRASDSVSGVESLYMKAPNSSYYSSVGSSSKTISSGSANGLYSFYAYDKGTE